MKISGDCIPFLVNTRWNFKVRQSQELRVLELSLEWFIRCEYIHWTVSIFRACSAFKDSGKWKDMPSCEGEGAILREPQRNVVITASSPGSGRWLLIKGLPSGTYCRFLFIINTPDTELSTVWSLNFQFLIMWKVFHGNDYSELGLVSNAFKTRALQCSPITEQQTHHSSAAVCIGLPGSPPQASCLRLDGKCWERRPAFTRAALRNSELEPGNNKRRTTGQKQTLESHTVRIPG